MLFSRLKCGMLKLRTKHTIFTKREMAKLVKASEINQSKLHFLTDILARNKERKFYSDKEFYFLVSCGRLKSKIPVNYVDLVKCYYEPVQGPKGIYCSVKIVALEVDFGNKMLGPYIRVRLYKDGVVWTDKYEKGWNALKGQGITFSCSLDTYTSC